MIQLTKHFTLAELCVTSHEDLSAANLIYGQNNQGKAKQLALFLETVRRILGDVPLYINSAIRCPELNKAIGGAQTSEHVKCSAADITPTNHSLEDAVKILVKFLPDWGQIILERAGGKEWIHISMGYPFRPKDKCRQVLKFDGKKYTNWEV